MVAKRAAFEKSSERKRRMTSSSSGVKALAASAVETERPAEVEHIADETTIESGTKRLPVTVLSGFLGSGKTTLLKHILNSNDHNLHIALIVNDMAEVNIDGAQVAKLNASKSKEQIVQMQNGCICCTLRGDFIVELARMAQSGMFDYLVIESSGISEPMQVAESFAFELNAAYMEMGSGIEDEAKKVIEEVAEKGGINAIATIDTMVTVVDAHNFFCEFETGAFLKDRFAKEDVPDEDERTISNLFADQLEFANVIIINKVDLVDEEVLQRVKGIVRTFNPNADLIEATRGKIDVKKIVNTKRFDYEEAKLSPGWLKSLQEMMEVEVAGKKRVAPIPETLEYGIGSFVYRARKPFHPERFYDFFKGKFHLFQRREEDEDGDGSEAGDKSDSKLGSEFDSDVDDDSDGSDDETNAKLEILEKGHASNESTPPTSVSSGKNEDSTDECEEDQSLTTIIENKRADPLLAGIYRLKGFIWLASRPKMTGEISAAGAILTVAGFQEWHAERVFGSCKPCLEIRDPQPIKELMGEMLQRQYEQPWLQISQKGRTVRRKVERFLHGCYYSTAEIKSWFAIVDDKATSEEDREEKLEEFLLDRFEDLNLEYIYLICKDFQKWGDRRQEVVFIGEKLDAAGLTAKLDACLLTDEEMLEWEAIMENDGLDKGAASMLKRAERRLKAAGPDISEEKREKLEDKVAEGRFYVAQAKEEKLEQRWNDDTWAEWTVDEGHDHEHDGEACELA